MSTRLLKHARQAGWLILDRLAPRWSARLALSRFVMPHRFPRKEREMDLIQSAQRLTLADGLSAFAWGAGPAVLLVHGWSGRGTQLGSFMKPLVAGGRRVVALDGPAHGDSAGRETNPFHFADALLATDKEIGPVDAIIAHSFGAVATVLALNQGLALDRVVLIACPSSFPSVIERFGHRVGLSRRSARQFLRLIEMRSGIPAEELDLTRIARRLKTPALVVHDREDPEVPFGDAEAVVKAWRGARLYPVTGAGHRRILWHPDVVAQAAEFILA